MGIHLLTFFSMFHQNYENNKLLIIIHLVDRVFILELAWTCVLCVLTTCVLTKSDNNFSFFVTETIEINLKTFNMLLLFLLQASQVD